eukprot:TRINITY_DN54289_c0_g1_i1.p1 TRINITY_DN54289_c0_g1~~TRINITY_DN54289_c0_g1_i1.p1  ORF type:complete len:183 (-),score=38.59 TRINITY_DN54289_c0_g1_i1:2-502(-)
MSDGEEVPPEGIGKWLEKLSQSYEIKLKEERSRSSELQTEIAELQEHTLMLGEQHEEERAIENELVFALAGQQVRRLKEYILNSTGGDVGHKEQVEISKLVLQPEEPLSMADQARIRIQAMEKCLTTSQRILQSTKDPVLVARAEKSIALRTQRLEQIKRIAGRLL